MKVSLTKDLGQAFLIENYRNQKSNKFHLSGSNELIVVVAMHLYFNERIM